MKVRPRFTGAPLLLLAGTLACWIVLSDMSSNNPLAVLLGSAAALAGLLGVLRYIRKG